LLLISVPMTAPCSPIRVKRAASPAADVLSPQKSLRSARCKGDKRHSSESVCDADLPKLSPSSSSESKASLQHQVKRAIRVARVAHRHLQMMKASLKSNAKRHADCKREVHKYQVVQEESRRLLASEASLSGASHDALAVAARKMARHLGKIGADQSLVENMPQVVLKCTSERTCFDRTIVDSTMFFIQHHKDVLDAELVQHMARQVKLEAAIAKQQRIVEAACSERDAAAKRLNLTPPAK